MKASDRKNGHCKVKDKLTLINNVIGKADTILIGGGMAYTFLLAKGVNIGKSIVDLDLVDDAKDILEKAQKNGTKILLPIDHVALDGEKVRKVLLMDQDMVGLDIGKDTIKLFKKEIKTAGQILWNGPVGKYEDKRFRNGTFEIAKAVANSKAYSIVGGGDSVGAINTLGFNKKINHLSTGGGASMKLMEGKVLPAIEVIDTL